MTGKKCHHHLTAKKCTCHHHHHWTRRKLLKRILAGVLIFLFIVLVVVLLVWAILQPKKPRFILQDATVYGFNFSAPNLLSPSIQVTISSRNPNSNIGIYYDKLDAFATYDNEQITYYTSIPPTYQGHKDFNVWSPFLTGVNVPVAPYNSVALSRDKADGTVVLVIKVNGRIRWKVGTFISGKYHLHVTCPAMITLGSRSTGIVVVGNAVKYQLVQRCSVSV